MAAPWRKRSASAVSQTFWRCRAVVGFASLPGMNKTIRLMIVLTAFSVAGLVAQTPTPSRESGNLSERYQA